MSDKRPNVLLVTGDHFRGDAMRCAGTDFLHTPNFDRLAAEGVRFCNASANNPICVPGRAAITTGNPSHICTGNTGNAGRIRDDQTKIAEHFVENGYRTYALGKLHYVPYQNPRIQHGFQVAELCEEGRVSSGRAAELWEEEYTQYLESVGWGGYQRAHGIGNNDIRGGCSPLPEEHYVDSWVTTRSIHHMEEHRQNHPDEPFFMWTSWIKPHSPYDPPRPFDTMYDPRKIPAPVGSAEDLAGRDPKLSVRPQSYGWDRMSPQAIQYSRAHYFGLMSFLDKQMGRLLEYLEETGQRENTIVLLTADHGDCLGDHGLFFKVNFMKGSVNIPFTVSAPGLSVPEGIVRETPVGQEDVLPTLCDLAGVPIPENILGKSVREVMKDPSKWDRPCYFAETGGEGGRSNMAFDGEWKYIYSELEANEELYNCKEDQDEFHNLADTRPEKVAEMRQALVTWLRDTGAAGMLDENGELKRVEFDPETAKAIPGQRWGLRPY